MPVVAIAPNDTLFDKLKSNLQEVRTRGGKLDILGDQTACISDTDEGVHVIRICEHAAVLSPIVHGTASVARLPYRPAPRQRRQQAEESGKVCYRRVID